ncbi:hypothetical protein ScPMuIL_009973 [Solemya velum]
MSEREVASFVFLDLETTGLLGAGERPRVTELCMVSVRREDMLTGQCPRVSNKLQICLNPVKMISPSSSLITGLFNDSLEYQGKFDVAVMDMVNAFLKRLPQPVSLLAHNGNNFDFRLLVAEANKLNRTFIEGLLCADTLEAFRMLDEEEQQTATSKHGAITQRELENTPRKPTLPQYNELKRKSEDHFWSDSYDVTALGHMMGVSKKLIKVRKQLNFESCDRPTAVILNTSETTKKTTLLNETCDGIIGAVKTQLPFSPEESEQQHDKSVKSLDRQDSLSDDELLSAVLDIESWSSTHTNTNTTQQENTMATKSITSDSTTQKPKLSYKLGEIYRRTFGSAPPVSHTAEGDVISLIRVSQSLSSRFTKWTDANSVPFSTVMPAYM